MTETKNTTAADATPHELGAYDVIVVGAGAAGIAAAVAAGRTGASVVLVERAGSIGGISATLPWLGFHDQQYRQVVRGLATEFVERLQAVGGAGEITLDPKCGSLVSIHGHHWKVIAFDLLEQAGVRVLLHTLVVDAVRDGSRVEGIVVESKSGHGVLRGSVVIDCSGDGDVAAVAGATWEKGRTGDGLVQAPTLVFRLGGRRQHPVQGGLPGSGEPVSRVARALSGAVRADGGQARRGRHVRARRVRGPHRAGPGGRHGGVPPDAHRGREGCTPRRRRMS
jgi:hypothetical protein